MEQEPPTLDAYVFIDVDHDEEPTAGDWVYGEFPVTYVQNGDKTIDTGIDSDGDGTLEDFVLIE